LRPLKFERSVVSCNMRCGNLICPAVAEVCGAQVDAVRRKIPIPGFQRRDTWAALAALRVTGTACGDPLLRRPFFLLMTPQLPSSPIAAQKLPKR
jgi:hypothetical protein